MLEFHQPMFCKRALFFCLLSSFFLLLTGCGKNTTATGMVSTQSGCAALHTEFMEVDWARGYSSLKELKQITDPGVQGHFTAIAGTSSEGQGLFFTDFTFTITRVLWDPQHQIQNKTGSITIHQTGGCTQDTFYKVSDDPLFRIGEAAILFLHQYSPGHYAVDGGPSGRFVVRKGIVQPINGEGVKLPAGTTEQQFYTMLQNA